MISRSGPGGAGSDLRGPKTTQRAAQERSKSRPEAVSEQPWWLPGAELAPKRLLEPSGETFWPPQGWTLALRFRSSQRFLWSLEPRTAGSKAAEPQGLGGPAGCAEHLNI